MPSMIVMLSEPRLFQATDPENDTTPTHALMPPMIVMLSGAWLFQAADPENDTTHILADKQTAKRKTFLHRRIQIYIYFNNIMKHRNQISIISILQVFQHNSNINERTHLNRRPRGICQSL